MQKLPDDFSIILSRTDSIGDVVLTLPVAGYLKKHFPKCKIIFLGRNYTRDVVALSKYVDEFISWDEAEEKKKLKADCIIHVFPVKDIAKSAKQMKIPIRIGTTGRLFHYFTCNRLIPLTRRRSSLHEAQLNLKLTDPLLKQKNHSLESLPEYFGFSTHYLLRDEIMKLITGDKFNLILHPKSKGSAREWGLDNFSKLIEVLPDEKFRIFITGTKEEGEIMYKNRFLPSKRVIDLTGKLTLKELIAFIDKTDGLIAASTGPLHIAAAMNKFALGLYPPIRPMHPGRWAPLGSKAEYMVTNKKCSECRKKDQCDCMKSISPEQVKNRILNWLNE